ncbi:MAG: RHS repeat-associated core domain-containing protein, partial [Terriglobales bacterium]
FVPLPGGATAEYLSWGLSHYRHADWLGSTRLESSTTHAILQDTAYAPFGEPYSELSGGNGEISFTGQNKDTDWLNYDFMYREQDPRAGRWISPDPAGLGAVDPTNPQTWNRYAYVMNNPLLYIDPDGTTGCEDDGSDCGEDGSNGDGSGFTFQTDVWASQMDAGFVFHKDVWSLPDVMIIASWLNQFWIGTPSGGGGGNNSGSSGNAPNNGSQTSKICWGTFEFGGTEADLGEGGAFTGVIHEHDSVDGNSVGNLTEVWGGGEVVAAGGGKITSTGDKSILQGFLAFVGAGTSAGPLAGIQMGYATGKGWGGLYVEGHLGYVAWGAGGYLRTSCKAGH